MLRWAMTTIVKKARWIASKSGPGPDRTTRAQLSALGVSLINDNLVPYATHGLRAYTISAKSMLTPWWKHYAQKFNPFRLIRRKTEMRWTPTEGDDEHLWDEHEYVALPVGGDNAAFPFVIVTSRQVPIHEDVLERVTHYCPLPPTP